MASFKINIGNPKTKKCYKTEVKEQQAAPLMGLNIGEKIEGSKLGMDGYEFQITGGTDYSGFPMRRGILGERKRIVIYKSSGFKGGLKGMKKRKTVCGHKINDKISAINLKVLKEGSKKLSDLFGGKAEEAKQEEKKEVKEEKPKEAVKEEKPEAKEQKPEEKKEAKQEQKPEQRKEEQK
ncbi:30S ribosomal protein S6e [Candidatus Woesearchaeota archaeon]|mgnify:CR=1 FL=1|nr:30S ribosomal protein S6e [Candidatus Woesearchaeota archaeon]|tara:strand:+ start:1344 stop:1883 length:540 start_codon:yes stop_codon:yes gene_type:complete